MKDLWKAMVLENYLKINVYARQFDALKKKKTLSLTHLVMCGFHYIQVSPKQFWHKCQTQPVILYNV